MNLLSHVGQVEVHGEGACEPDGLFQRHGLEHSRHSRWFGAHKPSHLLHQIKGFLTVMAHDCLTKHSAKTADVVAQLRINVRGVSHGRRACHSGQR